MLRRGAVPENINVLCIVAAAPAISHMLDKYEGLTVHAAAIDSELNENGYIVPGLGDAGDRCYGTL